MVPSCYPSVRHCFRPGEAGTTEQALNLTLILDKYVTAKRDVLHLAFMDLSCAFDMVDRAVLWDMMKQAGKMACVSSGKDGDDWLKGDNEQKGIVLSLKHGDEIGCERIKRPRCEVQIAGRRLELMADSGSPWTIVTQDYFKQVFEGIWDLTDLKEPDIIAESFEGRTIDVTGFVETAITFKERRANIKLLYYYAADPQLAARRLAETDTREKWLFRRMLGVDKLAQLLMRGDLSEHLVPYLVSTTAALWEQMVKRVVLRALFDREFRLRDLAPFRAIEHNMSMEQ
ncbi:hypothetical protein NDU88_002619 [Pleurodeles waltl]|uniref:Reverse transcriptase domain-containing protein n=1 Tax=Pleurodeles waltl TaxID=8319 RepID=A0AAV7WP34_PLEWA|nr:hypothetical protein NDU88_002619 [Pleurodeles waltl]